MNKSESLFLRFLYKTHIGRIFLKIVSSVKLSKLCEKFWDSSFSKIFIKSFVNKNNININDYYCDEVKNFNEFFSRKIKENLRPVNMDKNVLISPCDGLLSFYKIDKNTVFPIKQSKYSIESLLGGNKKLARKYDDGICLVFRLCINNYHRYCYIDDGKKGENIYIPGILHTVRPIALEKYPVFVQNCREYTVMETENFGTVTQIEIGALLIGKIKNHHGASNVIKGEEKGMFLYGGSTIILLLEKDKAIIDNYIISNSKNSIETPVNYGEAIGKMFE